MKKALVLGGSYFIGRRVTEKLLENGFSVFTLNRGTRKDMDARVHRLIADRDDPEQMRGILSGHRFEIVVDISGLNGAQAKEVCRFLNTERLGAFVFLSSSAVYDLNHLNPPYRESDPLAENKYWTFYGQNKIDAEKIYTQFFEQCGIPLIILRPPYVYGENNYAQRESFLFEHLLNGRPIIIPKSNNRIQFIEVGDLADTMIHLIGHLPEETLGIYNVGNTKAVTFRQWVECCGKAAGVLPNILEYDPAVSGRTARSFFPFFDYDNVLDIKKIKQLYPDEIDFIEGLGRAWKWFLREKENLVFKQQVADTEKEILIEIHETGAKE